MSTVVTITAGPSAGSGPDAVVSAVGIRISHSGCTVVPLVLRELPTAAGPAAPTDPDLAAAVAAVAAADGVVLVSPVAPAGDVGLLTEFLELVPPATFRGKPVLSLVVGETPARSPALSDALELLGSVGAAPLGAGCFLLDAHVRAFPGGGVVLDAAAALLVAETTDAFVAALTAEPAVAPRPRRTDRVSPVAGAPDLTVVRAAVDDPVLAPLLRDLMIEYSTRYGGPSPYTTLTEVPPSDFSAPDGAFLALTQDGETIAGGAIRRYDARTAEVKRVWTSGRHRRRGLALRLMAELERAALELGYRRIHLTTGRRQPEAVALYLAAGYLPRFDVTAEAAHDGTDSGPLAFGKELVPGAGLVQWTEPDDYYGAGRSDGRSSVAVSAG